MAAWAARDRARVRARVRVRVRVGCPEQVAARCRKSRRQLWWLAGNSVLELANVLAPEGELVG